MGFKRPELLPLLLACAQVSVPSAAVGGSIGANPTVAPAPAPAPRLGLDVLAAENFARLRGARALLTNETARAADGTRSLDALAAAPGVSVVALFTPKHGQAANKDEPIADAVDERWSLPVYSLYGKQTSPNPKLLRGVDTVVVDLPDAGVRFYTHASTLDGMLRVAAKLACACSSSIARTRSTPSRSLAPCCTRARPPSSIITPSHSPRHDAR